MEPKLAVYSFPYDANIDSQEHHYRITQNHAAYGVEQDGKVIAEVTHADEWQQISGTALSKNLLESICDHIENHFQ